MTNIFLVGLATFLVKVKDEGKDAKIPNCFFGVDSIENRPSFCMKKTKLFPDSPSVAPVERSKMQLKVKRKDTKMWISFLAVTPLQTV